MIVGITHTQDGSPVNIVPIIGKIGHGLPREKDSPAQKLKYFIARVRDVDTGEYVEDPTILRQYGPEPRAIKIILPYNDIDKLFFTELRMISRRTGRMICHGNGIVATRYNHREGTKRQIECNPSKCEFAKDRSCKPFGRLVFTLPGDKRIGAAWKYETTSTQGIRQIYSGLLDIKNEVKMILQSMGIHSDGFLAGLPVWLVLETYRKKYSRPDGETGLTIVGVVHLEFREDDWENRGELEKFLLSLIPKAKEADKVEVVESVDENKVNRELVDEYYGDAPDGIDVDDDAIIIGDVSVPLDVYKMIEELPKAKREKAIKRISEMSQEEFDQKIDLIKDFVTKK